MNFYCSICNKTIEGGEVIFICRGMANEPVPDGHRRLRAMHEECAKKICMTKKYPVYILEDGTLYE